MTTPSSTPRDGRPPEVLVVGAGPVGLTVACQMARLGVSVLTVDALEHPTTESRAVAVHARSLETLAALGVVADLERRGRRIRSMDILGATGDSPLNRIDLESIASRHPYVLDIAQPDTEDVLRDRALELGVVVRGGTALVSLVQDDDGVDVTLRAVDGEQSCRVRWVVAADGGHSTARQLVGTRLEGTFRGRHFAMADVDVATTLPRDAIAMFPHPAGIAMLFPLEDDRARVMFMVDDPGAQELTFPQVQALAAERTAGRVAVSGPRWLTYFEVHHGQVPQYRHGRVFLVGDAAHIHSPAGGQGMNTGIQDAANLAWKLALVSRGRADAQLLDSYHDERHPVGEAVVRGTTRLTDAATSGGALAALRSLAMWVVGHVHRLNEIAATAVSEVVIGYRDSALSVEHGRRPHGAVRAGEHVPDPAGLQGADGSPLAVEDLFAQFPGLLLFVAGEPETVGLLREVVDGVGHVVPVVARPDHEHGGLVVDPQGRFLDALGIAGGGLALVRPDGYLGLITTDTDPDVVRRYLADVLHLRQGVPGGRASR